MPQQYERVISEQSIRTREGHGIVFVCACDEIRKGDKVCVCVCVC